MELRSSGSFSAGFKFPSMLSRKHRPWDASRGGVRCPPTQAMSWLGGDVDGGLHAEVALARLVEGVADRRRADAAGHGDRAHHVQDDADLAFVVPPQACFGDHVEQVVGGQRLVRRRVEVVLAA